MNPDNDKKNPSIADTDSTLKDLNDAGVEISARVSEENEFSNTPGVQNEAVTTMADMVKPVEPVKIVEPAVPLVTPPAPTPIAPPAYIPSASIPPAPTPVVSPAPISTAPAPSMSVKPAVSIPSYIPKPSAIQNEINAALGVSPSKSAMKSDTEYKNDPSIKQLRTFKTDAEEAVRYQNVSKVNIAVAEHKKKEDAHLIEYETGPKHSSSSLVLVIILLLILGGAGAGGYYWFFMRSASPTNNISKTFSAQTLIPYDGIGTVTLSGENNPLAEISQNLSQTNTQIGQTYALIPLPTGTTTVRAALPSVFSETQMPDRLSRSLGSDYMFGSYIYNQNGPFIILKNTFFQNAFAGMLEWEKNMRNDLISIIRVNHPLEQPIIANSDIFSDMVVSNIDTRVLRDSENSPILVYAFADKDTIVIATNIDTLKYVLGRLLSVRVVQ